MANLPPILEEMSLWANATNPLVWPETNPVHGADVFGVATHGREAWRLLGTNGRSVWGINGSGEPYYNSEGVAKGDEARISLDGNGYARLTKIEGG